MTCNDPDHKPSPDGNGCIWRKRAYSIVVEARDSSLESNIIPGKFVRLPMPIHIVAHSRLDPTGLVYALCRHGLEEHPDPEIQATTRKIGWSWIRSKYLDSDGKCPVCRDEEPPADLVMARI